jgi:CheY-like chemotaxis protein
MDCTTTGWSDPTGTPPTTTVAVDRRRGTLIDDHGRGRLSDRHSACKGRDVSEHVPPGASPGREVWIVEDEPASATLAAELCEGWGAAVSVFRTPLPFLAALRDRSQPTAVVLDWRLEHELSAALFLATRHRYPSLPVIYWTGHTSAALPSMITDDSRTTVIDKAAGTEAFERALEWAGLGNGGRTS